MCAQNQHQVSRNSVSIIKWLGFPRSYTYRRSLPDCNSEKDQRQTEEGSEQ